jgi:predicted alpha/beta-hydrolase family hydrolase
VNAPGAAPRARNFPAAPHPAGLVLFPGAGTGADHSSLRAIEAHLADALPALRVRRVDFPYRRAGRRIPDRAPALVACVRDEVSRSAADWGCGTERLVIGGRSMGGRMCAMAVAGWSGRTGVTAADDAPLVVAGLACIAYPLHPPARPESLRVAHLPDVRVPTLLVSGTHDEFGSRDELASHAGAIAGPVTHAWLEGARHALTGRDAVVARHLASWIASLA